MKTLSNREDKTEILGRLRKLKPDSQRQWGKMSAHQMVCHLNDSFKRLSARKKSHRQAMCSTAWWANGSRSAFP